MKPLHVTVACGLIAVAIYLGLTQIAVAQIPQSRQQFPTETGGTSGRYQLVTGKAAGVELNACYVIDTQTGRVWESYGNPTRPWSLIVSVNDIK